MRKRAKRELLKRIFVLVLCATIVLPNLAMNMNVYAADGDEATEEVTEEKTEEKVEDKEEKKEGLNHKFCGITDFEHSSSC